MENFSATAKMLPGIGSPGGASDHSGFDLGAIPGMGSVSKLFLRFGLDSSFLVTLGLVLSFLTYSFSSITTITNFISANLVSSATVHSSDVTYMYVMRWLAVHHISTDCRLFCVTSRKNPQSYAVRRYSSYAPYGDGNRNNQEDDDEDGEDEGCCEDDHLGPKLKFTPAPGFLHFWHKGRPIIIHRKLDLSYYTGDIPDETIVLTTIGRSPTFLREILADARKDYLQAQSRKTMVYTLSPTPFAQKTWDQGRHRPSRDISTVIMPQESKEHLLCDVRDYLNPVTMRWYAQRGLPYRRGYLFYGPPGTGKTSLSLALAGELKLPLYILSLSTGSLTDETLTMLFVGLPRKCIVLLEDIDCAGVHRTGGHTDDWDASDEDSSDEEEDDEKKTSTKSADNKKSSSSSSKNSGGSSGNGNNSRDGNQPRRPRVSVSFSGLLNAIDGVASHEGRILIMTTNHRERLDSALIRPGRVDVQIEFGYAGAETLAEIFRELYKEIGGSLGGGGAAAAASSERLNSTGTEKRHKPTTINLEKAELNQLAEEFASKIPANRFTPAEVQGFLMSYKGQPKKALENVDIWLAGKTKHETKSEARKRARLEKSNKKLAAPANEEPEAGSAEPTRATTAAELPGNTFEHLNQDHTIGKSIDTSSSTGTRTPDNPMTDLINRRDGPLGNRTFNEAQLTQAFVALLQVAARVEKSDHQGKHRGYTTGTEDPDSDDCIDTKDTGVKSSELLSR